MDRVCSKLQRLARAEEIVQTYTELRSEVPDACVRSRPVVAHRHLAEAALEMMRTNMRAEIASAASAFEIASAAAS